MENKLKVLIDQKNDLVNDLYNTKKRIIQIENKINDINSQLNKICIHDWIRSDVDCGPYDREKVCKNCRLTKLY